MQIRGEGQSPASTPIQSWQLLSWTGEQNFQSSWLGNNAVPHLRDGGMDELRMPRHDAYQESDLRPLVDPKTIFYLHVTTWTKAPQTLFPGFSSVPLQCQPLRGKCRVMCPLPRSVSRGAYSCKGFVISPRKAEGPRVCEDIFWLQAPDKFVPSPSVIKHQIRFSLRYPPPIEDRCGSRGDESGFMPREQGACQAEDFSRAAV